MTTTALLKCPLAEHNTTCPPAAHCHGDWPDAAAMVAWIDSASYAQLLRKWRFAPNGCPLFQPPIGEHFDRIMQQRRSEETAAAQTAASKHIGWRQSS